MKVQREMDKEQAKCPPGTRRMGEEERLQLLAELKDTKKTVEAEIMKFPITMKTMAIRRRKEELEGQVAKIDANINTFSK